MAIIAALAIVPFGWITRNRGIPENSLSLSQCIWSSPECSTAAATWLIFILAVIAFLPALVTALSTNRAYLLESEPVLQLEPCYCAKEKMRDDKILAGEIIDDTLSGQVLGSVPAGYWSRVFEVENVGRFLARETRIPIGFRKEDQASEIRYLILGPIPKERKKHVVICGSEQILPLTIVFGEFARVRMGTKMRNIDLEAEEYESTVGRSGPVSPQLPLPPS